MKINPSDQNPALPAPVFLPLPPSLPLFKFSSPRFVLPALGTGDVIWSGRDYLPFAPVAIRTFSRFNRGAHSVLGNAVTTL